MHIIIIIMITIAFVVIVYLFLCVVLFLARRLVLCLWTLGASHSTKKWSSVQEL